MNFTTQKSICAVNSYLIRQYNKDYGDIAGNLWHMPNAVATGSRNVAHEPFLPSGFKSATGPQLENEGVSVSRLTTDWSDAK